MKETLLRLLLRGEALETPHAWKEALHDGDHVEEGTAEKMEAENVAEGEAAALLKAVDEVVPYLPDYSALRSELSALMTYCASTFPVKTDRMVMSWLQRTPSPHCGPFRRWVVRDWLKCSHLTGSDVEVTLRWRHALIVAAVNEPVKKLKKELVQHIAMVDEDLQKRLGDDKDEEGQSMTTIQQIDSIEGLLDFCFLHAEQLASCSFLCAAKLHALAVKTERAPAVLAESDEVLVRLRWYLLLKPLLFKPLLQHAVALKGLPEKVGSCDVAELDDLVGLVDVTTRERILTEIGRLVTN